MTETGDLGERCAHRTSSSFSGFRASLLAATVHTESGARAGLQLLLEGEGGLEDGGATAGHHGREEVEDLAELGELLLDVLDLRAGRPHHQRPLRPDRTSRSSW